MTAPLITSPYAPHLADARALQKDVEAAGGAMPARLVNLLDAAELLRAAPSRPNPADAIMAAAVAGELTAKKLDTLARDAALVHTTDQYRADLHARASTLIAKRFAAELADGGADEVLDGLRGEFDAAAQVIEDGVTSINLSQDYAAFIETATPEQLAAYQQLKAAVATVDRIVAIPVKYFGLQSITGFGTIQRPSVDGVGQLGDTVIFTSPPGSNIAAESHRHLEFTMRGTQQGMRFSVWLRGGLRLNTVAEARELVRAWAEVKFDNSLTAGLVGRLANPYTPPEALGEVEIFPLDEP
jgi:hypothetical protein